MKTVLLIDGFGIMHRAFFALPEMQTTDGTPTNALYGFFTMLYRVINDFQPDYIAVCFDTPKPTFRKKMYDNYQSHRPETVDNFKVQIPLIKDLLDKMGVYRIEKEGYEADDVIGTLAKTYAKDDLKVFILTSDKDMLQLVNKNVTIISPKVGISSITLYNPEEVKQKLGIPPSQVADYKALVGDPSDNYPGAKGIGPKTAANLLQRYQTVEHVMNHRDELAPRIKDLITEHLEDIKMSKTLATIVTNVEINTKIDDLKFRGFKPEASEAFQKLGHYTLMQRIFKEKLVVPPPPPPKDQLDLF